MIINTLLYHLHNCTIFLLSTALTLSTIYIYYTCIYILYLCIQGKGPKADNIVNSVHIKFQALDVSLVYYAYIVIVYVYIIIMHFFVCTNLLFIGYLCTHNISYTYLFFHPYLHPLNTLYIYTSLTPHLLLYTLYPMYTPYIDGHHGDGGDPEGRVFTVRGGDGRLGQEKRWGE